MAFKFRLEAVLRLAEQEMQVMQGELAQAFRALQKATEQKNAQALRLAQALKGQRQAAFEEPAALRSWQRYSLEQRGLLIKHEKEVEKQQKNVASCQERLIQCRIKVEKYKRLKEKKRLAYYKEELKKEQAMIDEVAQNLKVRHEANVPGGQI